jgi:hypothetical protein
MIEEKNSNEPQNPAFLVGAVSGSASLTESQIEHQIEMDEEEDSYWMDDDEEDEILGYECLGCGNVQNHQSGFGCDRCMGHCLEPWYG